ncbi:MAG: aminotransferase class I/II-fold pyridoxal phosphate-dependent enzyme [Clostridium sp.]
MNETPGDGDSPVKYRKPAPFGFQAPSWILDAIRDALDDPMSQGYSESNGIVEAREAILDYHRSKGLPNLEMNHIYIGNGVSEMISLAMQGLLNDGDEILIPAPDYPLWTAAKLVGGTRFIISVMRNQLVSGYCGYGEKNQF